LPGDGGRAQPPRLDRDAASSRVRERIERAGTRRLRRDSFDEVVASTSTRIAAALVHDIMLWP